MSEAREVTDRARMTIANSNRIIQCFTGEQTKLLIASAHIHFTIAAIRIRARQERRSMRAMEALRERSKFI